MPMRDSIEIEGPQYGAGPDCEKVLRDLPEWFGIEEATRNYIEQAHTLPTFLAKLDAKTVGFISAKMHFSASAELYVLGVMRDFHRQGIGTLLLEACEHYLSEQGVRFVQVKTLAASRDDPHYAATRKFYEGAGYVAFEEFPDLWDPHNPCLQMIKGI